MKFYCIGDEDTVRGFRLAGIAGQIVVTAEQAETAVENAAAQPDCGIMVLTEKVAAGIRQQVETIRLKCDRPLVVEIPGLEGPLPDRKRLHQFVQEAVGVGIG